MLDVPPAQAADVAVRARARPPTSWRWPSTARCAGSGRRPTSPSWTPRTSRSPAAAQRRVGLLVAVGEHVVVGHRQLAAGDPPGQPGAVLDDQRVGADVVDGRGEDGVERGGPVGVGLPRRAVDQVEVDVLEPGGARPRAAASTARPGVCRRSRTASTCSAADCMPRLTRVKPASRSRASEAGVDRLRVGLGGHLDVVGDREQLADLGEDGGEVVGRQQRGRAAADEDRARPWAGRGRASRAARRSSAIAVPAYSARLAPGPSSSEV